jgi:predicted nuclease of predicted toxin-antitoxin system
VRRSHTPRVSRKGGNFPSRADASSGRHEPHAPADSGVGQRRHEALHWSEAGDTAASDKEICSFAREHEYVILTNDLDFPQILAHTRQSGPSVVLLRGEPLTPEARGPALLQALRDCPSELAQGAIVSLDWSGTPRARVLPLNASR